MKNLTFCLVLLLTAISYNAVVAKPVQTREEPLNLKWQEINGVSIPIPPKQHPRLYLRSCHIPQLQERMKDPILSKVWQQLTDMSKKVRSEDDGVVRDWRYYVDQRGVSVQVEMDALRYLMNKDRTIARKAVKDCLEHMQNTEYPPEAGDIARASGRLMVTGAIVYDWCYDVLTADEKAAGSHGFEGQVSGFGAEDGREDVHGLNAQRAGGLEGGGRDDRTGVARYECFGDGGCFGRAAGVAQESVEVGNAHAAAQNAFAADVAVA